MTPNAYRERATVLLVEFEKKTKERTSHARRAQAEAARRAADFIRADRELAKELVQIRKRVSNLTHDGTDGFEVMDPAELPDPEQLAAEYSTWVDELEYAEDMAPSERAIEYTCELLAVDEEM